MLVIALLVVMAWAGFVALSVSARRGNDSACTAALYEGVVLLILAGLAAVGWLVFATHTCSGGCFENTPADAEGWWYAEDPWQADALAAVLLVGFAAVAAGVAWTWRGRHRSAAVAMTVAVAAFGTWAVALVLSA